MRELQWKSIVADCSAIKASIVALSRRRCDRGAINDYRQQRNEIGTTIIS